MNPPGELQAPAAWAGWTCKRTDAQRAFSGLFIRRRYAENSKRRRVLAWLQRD